MTKKKTLKASERKLKRTVTKLEVEVEAVSAKAARWKKRAKQNESATEAARSQVAKLEHKLAKLRRTPTPVEPDAAPEAEGRLVAPAQATATPAPDETWTVPALRNEARSRGLTGWSRASKATLLKALS